MLRKLFLILGLSLIAFPASVLGLGLGEIRSASFLNEPFKGEIDLIGVKTTELDTVKVRLASEKEFAKIGAERFYFLSQLQFQPQAGPSGRAVIAVTSNRPIREPFLDFLVEVNWPQGRLVKEYTVLLDPPVTLPGVMPPARVPAVVSAPAERVSPQAARSSRAGKKGAASPQPPGAVATYGPVQRGETLWSIAKRFEGPGASHQQVMQALVRENPEAFIGGDMNKLKAGATLSLTAQGASSSDVSSVPPGVGQAAPAVSAEDRLRIAPPKSREPIQGGESGKGAAAGQEGSPEGVNASLNLVREESESIRQETGELRDRVLELESQLADVRKLLKLRNAQLAQLQVAVMGAEVSAGAESAKTSTGDSLPASPTEAKDTEISTPGAVGGDRIAAVDTQPGRPAPAGVADAPLGREVALGGQTGIESATKEASPAVGQASSEKSPPAPITTSRPEANSSSWMDTTAILGGILGEPTSLAVLGSTVVVLLILLTFSVSRRQRAEAEVPLGSPASEVAEAQESWSSVQEPRVTVAPRERVEKTEQAFRRQPQMDVGEEEKDVLAEADVYLGFARYKDAAALVISALEREPGRVDLKVKLAEIYHSAGDSLAFSRVFRELQSNEQSGLDQRTTKRLSAMAAALGVDRGPEEMKTVAEGAIPEASPWAEQEAETAYDFPKGEAPETAEERLDQDSDLDLESVIREIEQTGFQRAEDFEEARPQVSDEREVLEWPDKLGPEPQPLESESPLPEPQALELDMEIPKPLSLGEEPDAAEPLPLEGDTHAAMPQDLSRAVHAYGDEVAGDETAIKLDLARAYLAMSDKDGARFILEEIIEEGEGEEKAEAKRLLASLG